MPPSRLFSLVVMMGLSAAAVSGTQARTLEVGADKEFKLPSTAAAAFVERDSTPIASPPPAPVPRGGVSVWAWVVVALLIAAAVAFFLLKGRS